MKGSSLSSVDGREESQAAATSNLWLIVQRVVERTRREEEKEEGRTKGKLQRRSPTMTKTYVLRITSQTLHA